MPELSGQRVIYTIWKELLAVVAYLAFSNSYNDAQLDNGRLFKLVRTLIYALVIFYFVMTIISIVVDLVIVVIIIAAKIAAQLTNPFQNCLHPNRENPADARYVTPAALPPLPLPFRLFYHFLSHYLSFTLVSLWIRTYRLPSTVFHAVCMCCMSVSVHACRTCATNSRPI